MCRFLTRLVEISWNTIGRIVKNLLGLKICENTRRIKSVSSKIFLKLTKTDKIVKLLVLSYVHQENKTSYVCTSLELLIPSFTIYVSYALRSVLWQCPEP
jgi:hypothetical protein